MNEAPDTERYPFRRRPDETIDQWQARTWDAIYSMEGFIISQVARRVPRQHREDVAQEIRCKLFSHALPAWDAHRGQCKLSSYLCRCILNAIREVMQPIYRRQQHEQDFDDGVDFDRIPGQDLSQSVRVDAAIGRLHRNPRQFLTATQTLWFNEVNAHPNELIKNTAKRLGYKQPSTGSMLTSRISNRLKSALENEEI